MRVLIAGGSGLIGGAVTRALAAQGDEVVVLSRDPSRVQGLPQGARAVRWDGRSGNDWATLLEPGAGVINLAGEPIAGGRWTAARKRRILDSRLQAGQAVMDALRQAQAAGRAPAVLLQASGIGYYGDTGTGEAAVGEDSPAGQGFLARAAVSWEGSTAAAEPLGVRRAVLRTGIVLDRAGGALAKMLPPFRLGAGGPLGSGRQWMPWIHAADEVGAILFLLRNGDARGPFNLCVPRAVRNREFAHALGRRLHRPSVLPAPGAALSLLLGEMAEVVLAGQNAVPARLLAAGYKFRFPDLDGALVDLFP